MYGKSTVGGQEIPGNKYKTYIFFCFPQERKTIFINFSVSMMYWYLGSVHFDYSPDLLMLGMIEKPSNSVKANLSNEMSQDVKSLKGTNRKRFYGQTAIYEG